MPDFSNIDYLRSGSAVQQQGWNVLTGSRLLERLRPFHPVLAGTLPLDLFIESKSDLDILCEAPDLGAFEDFIETQAFEFKGLSVRRKYLQGVASVIVNFRLENFPVEIVAQPLPVNQHVAFRHLWIEYFLLQHRGEAFKNQVLALKQKGMKTEPAFATVLQLPGDPYEALLKLEADERNRTYS